MSPQRTAELEYWRGEFERFATPEEYAQVRMVRDFQVESTYLPQIWDEHGAGLDLACGLVSVLERVPGVQITAVDALMPEYEAIYKRPPQLNITYERGNGEELKYGDGRFDFVWCMNAIDHTPNPDKMLSEIHRVLKPGGRMYFLVNFDPALYAPHYQLWNMRTVEEHMSRFHLQRGTLFYETAHKKYIWSALYTKGVPK